MPWHQKATKGVASCDSLGEPQAGRDPRIPEWGNLGDECRLSAAESIGSAKPTQGSETSQYLQEKKATCDSPSSGERKGKSPNPISVKPVCVGDGGLKAFVGRGYGPVDELPIRILAERSGTAGHSG